MLTHLKNNELKQAEENFSKAQSCFVNAKLGGFPNAHAYHAHAYMFFKRGQETSQMKEKIEDYAEALKILEFARDNLNTETYSPSFNSKH